MYRNPASFLMPVALLFTVLACSDDDAPPGATGGDGGDLVFRTVVKIDGIAWFDRMTEGVDRFAGAHDIDSSVIGPAAAEPGLQTPIIEDLIAQEVDAMCVIPVSPADVEDVLAQARQAGIKVVTHEAARQTNTDYDVEAFDNAEYGAALMDELAERMGEEGEYAVFVGTLGSETHNEWVDAAVARQRQAYPNMTLVGEKVEAFDDPDTAYEKAKALLTANPDLKGFQGSGSTDVAGIGRAIAEAGLEDETVVVGTSLPSIAGNLLDSGAIDLIGFWDPAAAGEVCNAVALRLIEGEMVTTGADLGVEGYESVVVEGKVIYGDAAVYVTADNAGDYPF